MKHFTKAVTAYKMIIATLIALFIQIATFAQDDAGSSTTVTTHTHSESSNTWYTQPWAWIVGGIILVLILIALFSGGRDKVIVRERTTTEREV